MFEYTPMDLEKVINGYFISIEPPILRLFPPKQKRKYIVLEIIMKTIDSSKTYSESELNDVLIEIYPDFVTLRRALIDFRFMSRTTDGKEYWVNNKD